jgi:hypothetical protein
VKIEVLDTTRLATANVDEATVVTVEPPVLMFFNRVRYVGVCCHLLSHHKRKKVRLVKDVLRRWVVSY